METKFLKFYFPTKRKDLSLHSSWLQSHSIRINNNAFRIGCTPAKHFLADHLFQPNKGASYKHHVTMATKPCLSILYLSTGTDRIIFKRRMSEIQMFSPQNSILQKHVSRLVRLLANHRGAKGLSTHHKLQTFKMILGISQGCWKRTMKGNKKSAKSGREHLFIGHLAYRWQLYKVLSDTDLHSNTVRKVLVSLF